MAQTVYLETSIFSFYFEKRTSPAAVAMQGWTRQWWDNHRHRYLIATSWEMNSHGYISRID